MLSKNGQLCFAPACFGMSFRHGHTEKLSLTLQVAMGFVRVANETMCRPIRALTQMKGYDVAQHCLACFGGAGGQHACAIAQNLGMRTIFVQRYAGVLSAVGIGLADVVAEEQVRALLRLAVMHIVLSSPQSFLPTSLSRQV